MKRVFAHLRETCRKARLPVGVLPIEVSLVVQPEESVDLTEPTFSSWLYGCGLDALRLLAKPYVAWKSRPLGSTRSAEDLDSRVGAFVP